MALLHVETRTEGAHLYMGFDLILPQTDPDGVIGPKKSGPYPVLFLLHPQGWRSADWISRSMLEPLVTGLPLAVVMPSCYNSYWINMAYGREYQDMLIRELPALIPSVYAVSREPKDHFIAGAGSGAYGALMAAMQGGNFACCAGYNSLIDVKKGYDQPLPVPAGDLFGDRASFDGGRYDAFAAVRTSAFETPVWLYTAPGDPTEGENREWAALARSCGKTVREKTAPDLNAFLKDFISILPIDREG